VKVLYVSCQVKEAHLWDLLSLLKSSKAANVEVHPVGEPEELNGKAEPKRYRRKKKVRKVVAEAMELKKKVRVDQLSEQLNANPKSVYSALSHMMDVGTVKRTAPGEFMRVKEDAQ